MSTNPRDMDSSLAEARYRSLFDAHFADIWRFARRRCDSAHDADDVAAETFAVAWRRRDDMPIEDARLWLFGVARRVLANERRSAERQNKVRLRLIESAAEEASTDAIFEPQSVVWDALAVLSAGERDLIIMRAWDGLTIGEIATILGCTANGVSLRLYKARRKMAREMQRKEKPATGHVESGSLSPEGGRL